MNNDILNTGHQIFINKNLGTDISSLLLKGTQFDSVSTKELVEQIEAKKKCSKKLPTWFKTKSIYYPNKLNIEQTSSEITAQYKANLVHGNSLIDLTGGFGVDCFFFAKKIDKVIHCEVDDNLSKIATHNYKILGIKNIDICTQNGLDYLQKLNRKFDWIYIDPSRRNEAKNKVFFLSDCSPDIPKNLELIFKYSDTILIKTSPLLDLTIGIHELKFVKEIHIVAVKNEVKELLWILEKEYKNEVNIKTINIKNDENETFYFTLNDEKESITNFSTPKKYLYEPNSALLKSGAFNIISKRLKVSKLHKHSHLYTSNELINFPGRSFKIENILPYNKKMIRKYLKNKKVNVSTRNFPETVAQIRKKLSLKDGGYFYLFFTTNIKNDKIVIICVKNN